MSTKLPLAFRATNVISFALVPYFELHAHKPHSAVYTVRKEQTSKEGYGPANFCCSHSTMGDGRSCMATMDGGISTCDHFSHMTTFNAYQENCVICDCKEVFMEVVE